jgi:hypothetical protein
MRKIKYGKDKNGILFTIDEMNVDINKGLQCNLYHPLTNEPLQACCLNSNAKKKRHFRTHQTERKGNPNPNTNESCLHKFVKEMFKRLNGKTINVNGQDVALLGYVGEEQRIPTTVNRKEVQAYTPDVLFKGIAIEVIVSSEIKDSKRGFYEGLNYKLITVRYSDEERKGNSMVNEYLEMELEEVLEDIVSRCEIQKPIRDVFSQPYIEKIKSLQEKESNLQEAVKNLQEEVRRLKNKPTQGESTISIRQCAGRGKFKTFKRVCNIDEATRSLTPTSKLMIEYEGTKLIGEHALIINGKIVFGNEYFIKK